MALQLVDQLLVVEVPHCNGAITAAAETRLQGGGREGGGEEGGREEGRREGGEEGGQGGREGREGGRGGGREGGEGARYISKK